jgi:hypothetical protein
MGCLLSSSHLIGAPRLLTNQPIYDPSFTEMMLSLSVVTAVISSDKTQYTYLVYHDILLYNILHSWHDDAEDDVNIR